MEDRTPSGVRLITLREVAVRAGVSVSTASRALTGARRVTPDIVERVQSAARALGYRPNEAARNLRLSRTMTIGCVYHNFWSPVLLDFMDGFSGVCQARNYSVITASARGDAELYHTLVHQLFERRMDALVVVLPPDLGDVLQSFHAASVPVLSVFSYNGGLDELPLVEVEEGAASAQAVKRLSELGHKRILHMTTLEGARSLRAAAVLQAASDAGMEVTVERIPPATALAAIRGALKRERVGTKTTAVLANQPFLPYLTDALDEAGLAVPADVSVIVFSESRWMRNVGLPWSSVRLDLLDVGHQAANLILDWLDGTPPPRVTMAGIAEFVERASIGPAKAARSRPALPAAAAHRALAPSER